MEDQDLNRRTATPDTLLPLNSSTSQPSSVVSRKPYKTIEPRSGLQAINLRQLWRFRDLLLTLAERDIKLRYRQTALGIIWVILQPLIAAGIFSFVFGGLAKMPSGGIPYFVFSYAGLLGWNVFSNTLTKCSTVLIQNSQLISKVFFPRLVLPLSTVFSTLIDFGVALGMMVVLMVLYRVAPSAGLILLPVWLILISLLALGVGLYAAALTVSYRDIQYIIPVVIQFLLFGSPVAYAVPHLREPLRTIYYLNPLASLLEAFRWSLLGKGELQPTYLAYASVFSCLVFVGGAYAFKSMERRFADVI